MDLLVRALVARDLLARDLIARDLPEVQALDQPSYMVCQSPQLRRSLNRTCQQKNLSKGDAITHFGWSHHTSESNHDVPPLSLPGL